jgi:Tfp pilus assembly protein PilN
VRAVNLLPREEPRRAGPSLTVPEQLVLAAPLLAVAIVLAGFLLASAKVSSQKRTVSGLQQELSSLPKPKRPVVVDQALVSQHSDRVAALAQALSGRVAWDRILREISSILPEDVWLTSLNVQSPGSTASPSTSSSASASTPGSETPATPAPTSTTSTTPSTSTSSSGGSSPLTIEGYTYSQEGVARFMARLAVIPELMDVTLEKSALTDVSGRNVVGFTIQANIRGVGAGS